MKRPSERNRHRNLKGDRDFDCNRQGKDDTDAKEGREPDTSAALCPVGPEGVLMDILDAVFLSNVRNAPAVTEQPEVQIREWRFSRQWDASTVLLGFPSHSLSLRTTSPVVCVNGRRVTTSSGRQYLLVGEPAASAEVLIAMAAFLATRRQRFCDVTAEVLKVAADGVGGRNLH